MRLAAKHQGLATLVTTIILLVGALLVILFATQYNFMVQKSVSNQYVGNQAFQAAEAGLEYGFAYLLTNSATVTANPSGGHITYTLPKTALANGASYTVVYTNPTANNYQLLQITSTGGSADGTSTSTVRQQVAQVPATLFTLETLGSVIAHGAGGNVTGNQQVQAGGSVDSSVSTGGTVVPNDSTVSGMTGDQFFQYFFNESKTVMQSQSTVYADSDSVPWGSVSGTTIWVNSATSLTGNTTIASSTSPILLIVNGDFNLAGNTIVNGVVYATGNVTISGNGTVNGAVISEQSITFNGTQSQANYNSTIVQSVINRFNPGFSGYGKVSGSWRDF